MAKVEELNREARKSYYTGKYRDAALTWLQASELSRELQDEPGWYKYRVWAADSFDLCNEIATAMNLLLEVHVHEPHNRPDYEAWLARKRLYVISLFTFPKKEKLEKLIQEMETIANKESSRNSDFHWMKGYFHYVQGQFNQTLVKHEKGWQSFCGPGFPKYCFAFAAAICCLKLDQLSQAKEWYQAISNLDQDDHDIILRTIELSLRIAIAEGKDIVSFSNLLKEYSDEIQKTQFVGLQDTYSRLNTHVQLLQYAKIDPLDKAHPARQTQLQKIQVKKDVHEQFERRLHNLDFRLAALRFYTGVAPVDDLYYTHPQQLPTTPKNLNLSELKKRLQRTMASYRFAEHYGKKIDSLLECDWRQKEVQSRLPRIAEIANSYNLDPNDF